jgi:hypothetical protein
MQLKPVQWSVCFVKLGKQEDRKKMDDQNN